MALAILPGPLTQQKVYIMTKKLIIYNNVSIEQNEDLTFKVVYGLQVKDTLEYNAAAEELGYCILHALACDSDINTCNVV